MWHQRVVDRMGQCVDPCRLPRADDHGSLCPGLESGPSRPPSPTSRGTPLAPARGLQALAGPECLASSPVATASEEPADLRLAGSRSRWSAIVPVTVYVDSTTYRRFIVSVGFSTFRRLRERAAVSPPRPGRSRGSRCRARGCGRSSRSRTSRTSFLPEGDLRALQRFRSDRPARRCATTPSAASLDVLADEPQRRRRHLIRQDGEPLALGLRELARRACGRGGRSRPSVRGAPFSITPGYLSDITRSGLYRSRIDAWAKASVLPLLAGCLRVALDLRRPAVVAFDQHRQRAAGSRECSWRRTSAGRGRGGRSGRRGSRSTGGFRGRAGGSRPQRRARSRPRARGTCGG